MRFLVCVIAESLVHGGLRQGGDVGLVGKHELLQEVSGDHGLLWAVGNTPESVLSQS
jgi:hypothetical protein